MALIVRDSYLSNTRRKVPKWSKASNLTVLSIYIFTSFMILTHFDAGWSQKLRIPTCR